MCRFGSAVVGEIAVCLAGILVPPELQYLLVLVVHHGTVAERFVGLQITRYSGPHYQYLDEITTGAQ